MESFSFHRLRTKSVFKIIFVGLSCSLIPLWTILGILASFGVVNLYWGPESITGFKAVVLGPFFGIIITIVFGFFTSVFASLGLILFSKRKGFSIDYYQNEPGESN